MNKTYRIYGKVLESWEHEVAPGRVRIYQEEIEYKEYDQAGELVGVGSEDFSMDREKKRTARSLGVDLGRRKAE